MIIITSNASGVLASVIARVRKLSSVDQLMRSIAETMLPVVKKRIHTDGLAADGNPIGTYSPGYMKLRTKGYQSDVITRGKDKGKPREIIKFNRTADTKVIISMTRQMEGDWSIIPTAKGYGLGYKNEENLKKVGYVEATYDKPIFKLTEGEHKNVVDIAKDYKEGIVNG